MRTKKMHFKPLFKKFQIENPTQGKTYESVSDMVWIISRILLFLGFCWAFFIAIQFKYLTVSQIVDNYSLFGVFSLPTLIISYLIFSPILLELYKRKYHQKDYLKSLIKEHIYKGDLYEIFDSSCKHTREVIDKENPYLDRFGEEYDGLNGLILCDIHEKIEHLKRK